ncbi:MAG: GH32 C-terminal domain-containing protein [Merdibacter sp.]
MCAHSVAEHRSASLPGSAVTLDITACGCGRTTRSVHLAQLHDLHLFSDTSSLEVFLNEGSEVFTTRIYPTRPRCVKLKTEGQPAILRLHALSAHQIR